MALINCPECGKQVSERIESCINCGYILKPNFKQNEETLEATTPIKYASANPALGMFSIIFAIVMLAFSLALGPFGIISGAVGILGLISGFKLFKKSIEINCPHCNEKNTLPLHTERCKCMFCQKISIKQGHSFKLLD